MYTGKELPREYNTCELDQNYWQGFQFSLDSSLKQQFVVFTAKYIFFKFPYISGVTLTLLNHRPKI